MKLPEALEQEFLKCRKLYGEPGREAGKLTIFNNMILFTDDGKDHKCIELLFSKVDHRKNTKKYKNRLKKLEKIADYIKEVYKLKVTIGDWSYSHFSLNIYED